MRIELCLDSIDTFANGNHKAALFTISADEMKILAMYGYQREFNKRNYIPADVYLSQEARNKINTRIEEHLKITQLVSLIHDPVTSLTKNFY